MQKADEGKKCSIFKLFKVKCKYEQKEYLLKEIR